MFIQHAHYNYQSHYKIASKFTVSCVVYFNAYVLFILFNLFLHALKVLFTNVVICFTSNKIICSLL